MLDVRSIDALFETSGAVCDEVVPRSVAGASADAVAPCAASVGKGFATYKCDLEDGMGTESDSQRVLVIAESEAWVSEETSGACLENSRIHNSRSGCLDSSLSVLVSSHARARTSLTVSCLARPAGAPVAVASVASPAVSRVRSYAEVASAACDDAVALHDSSLCSRNSGGTGGLLLVQRSTSYCLDNSWLDTVRVQGPTGTRRIKGGVYGPAEDFLPVSEVEAG